MNEEMLQGLATLFASIGTFAALGALVRAVHDVIDKRRAQQELTRRLQSPEFSARLHAIIEEAEHDGFSLENVRELQALFETAADTLPPKEKRQVWPGLRQPSDEGRRDYMRRLLSETTHVV